MLITAKRILALLIVVFQMSVLSEAAIAEPGDGTLGAYIRSATTETKDDKTLTVMITIFRNGTAVAQRETDTSEYVSFSGMAPGAYTVRFEGRKMKTIQKEGILVTSKRTTDLRAVMEFGSGMRVEHYSTHPSVTN